MKLHAIEARDLPDAWYRCLYNIIEFDNIYTIDRGSYEGQQRLEFNYVTIHIKYPNVRPLLPDISPYLGIPNPVADDYLDEYLPYLMTDALKEGEAYTYGQRLTRYPVYLPVFPAGYSEWTKKIMIDEIDQLKEENIIFFYEDSRGYRLDRWCLNQIELVIWIYKNKGFGNNQMVLQVAEPNDMLLKDPPCLRHIDTRIQDGKLHFIVYVRSWDLWSGFPANLAVIQLLKEYMAAEIGVEDGEIIASSKGLHLYDYVWNIAKQVTYKEF